MRPRRGLGSHREVLSGGAVELAFARLWVRLRVGSPGCIPGEPRGRALGTQNIRQVRIQTKVRGGGLWPWSWLFAGCELEARGAAREGHILFPVSVGMSVFRREEGLAGLGSWGPQ